MTELYFYRFVAFWILLAAAFFLGQHYATPTFEYQRFPTTASLADIPPIRHPASSAPVNSVKEMPMEHYVGSQPVGYAHPIPGYPMAAGEYRTGLTAHPIPAPVRQIPPATFQASLSGNQYSPPVPPASAPMPQSSIARGPASLSTGYPGLPTMRPHPPLRETLRTANRPRVMSKIHRQVPLVSGMVLPLRPPARPLDAAAVSPSPVAPGHSMVDEIIDIQQKMGGSQIARILDPVSLGQPGDASGLGRIDAQDVFRRSLADHCARPRGETASTPDQALEAFVPDGNLRSIAVDLRQFANDLRERAPEKSASYVRLADALEALAPERK